MRATTSLVVIAPLLLAALSCKDTNVPFYTAPTSVDNTQVGIQNAVTGLFGDSRLDVGIYLYYMPGFARDAVQLSEVNPENVSFQTGESAIVAAADGLWDHPYSAIGEAVSIIQSLPKAEPAYTAPQLAAATGAIQTVEAINFMLLAESHDTLGIPLLPTTSGPGPVYCNKDVWRFIVALLDSGNANLNTGGSTAIPFVLPPGFKAFQNIAGPSTVSGAFAAVNRALAAKAGLELAYAIARSSAADHPTPATRGNPDATALARADSAAGASSIFNPGALGPPPSGGFVEDATGAFWDFSPASGDLVNPIQQQAGVWTIMKSLAADIDTVNDLRWKQKFGPRPSQLPIQLPSQAFLVVNNVYAEYPNPSSPIPIIRNEGLVLIRAQIQLGMNNLANALTYLNDVRTSVGGLAPVTGADYVTVRDLLLKEQRPSTFFEASGDRTIALRMYHLEATADTTWGAADLHTTVLPVEQAEIDGRNGSYALTCN